MQRFVALVIALACIGCGKKADPKAAIAGVRDRACGCTTSDCIRATKAELATLTTGTSASDPEVVGALDCIAKLEAKPAETQPAAPAPADATVAVAVAVPVDATAPAAPVLPDVASVATKYGYCEMTFTGAQRFSLRVGLKPEWVQTDFWLTAATKARYARTAAKIAKEYPGPPVKDPEKSLWIFAADPDHEVIFHIQTSLNSKLKLLPIKPGSYPLTYHDLAEAPPGEFDVVIGVGSQNTPFVARAGTLDITKFEQGELEATFTIETESDSTPPDKVKVTGKIVYHCADYTACGGEL